MRHLRVPLNPLFHYNYATEVFDGGQMILHWFLKGGRAADRPEPGQ